MLFVIGKFCNMFLNVIHVYAGTHKVDVTYEGLNVPRSPFSVNVVPGSDPSRVRAFGPGIIHSVLATLLNSDYC